VGTAAGLAQTLAFYAAKSGNKEIATLARELLDRMWKLHRDEKGLTGPEDRMDYKRFGDPVFVPTTFHGKMPNGDPIENGATFISIRSKYKNDPRWADVQAFVKGGKPATFKYHRFWAQSHIALAYATYGWLFPEK
jgi:hypothetical protein